MISFSAPLLFKIVGPFIVVFGVELPRSPPTHPPLPLIVVLSKTSRAHGWRCARYYKGVEPYVVGGKKTWCLHKHAISFNRFYFLALLHAETHGQAVAHNEKMEVYKKQALGSAYTPRARKTRGAFDYDADEHAEIKPSKLKKQRAVVKKVRVGCTTVKNAGLDVDDECASGSSASSSSTSSSSSSDSGSSSPSSDTNDDEKDDNTSLAPEKRGGRVLEDNQS